ncbi:unnamed protein product [Strongylus vulgaris]|uniref:Arrestin C-terminal-like domain-containing protein n=1 Tax=Strongylus vulgaris TaxID=40348 RepID=A0A3P7L5F4_STRVU|nr:unnamed protein product [Strongylus vulgaris]
MIDLSRKDCCYTPGDTLRGRLLLKLSEGSIDITSLKITLMGLGRVNIKGKVGCSFVILFYNAVDRNVMEGSLLYVTISCTDISSQLVSRKKLFAKIAFLLLQLRKCHFELASSSDRSPEGEKEESLQKSLIYMKKEWTIVSSPTTLYDQERHYEFEDVLPDCIPSSFYSAKGHVQYSIIAVLEYKNNDGEPSMVKAVRGITIIEELDLNKLSKSYFEPISEFEQRKFGWFSCFGGQIRLTLNIDRTAFVCGEGMTTSLIDMQEMQEDILAMSVEQGANIKIDKKIHIPPVVPSTPTAISQRQDYHRDEHGGRFNLRRKSHILSGRLSISSQRSRTSLTSLPLIQRLMLITYKYTIRVKSGGVDIITMNVPVIIGSRPLAHTVSKDLTVSCTVEIVNSRDTNCTAVYKLCKHDRAIPLLDSKERTLCNKAQLQHLNKYPFFSDLSTSSKQSKKLGVIANTIRAENKVMNKIMQSVMDERQNESAASCSAAVTDCDSPDFIDSGREPTSAKRTEEVTFTKLDPLFQQAFRGTPHNSIDSPHPKVLSAEDLL